jgi:hypothetical protein
MVKLSENYRGFGPGSRVTRVGECVSNLDKNRFVTPVLGE